MRWINAALLGALLANLVHALPPPAKAPLEVGKTLEGLSGNDCGKYLRRAGVIAADARFAAQPKAERVRFLWQASNCAYELEKYDIAFRHADRAIALDPGIAWLQVVRLYYGSSYERPDASLDALQALSRIEPQRLRDLEVGMVNDLLRTARQLDEEGDAELAVYEALDRAGYAPPAPYFDDFLRMGRGRLLMERGRAAEARGLLRDIVDSDAVVELRVDRLFDPLRTDAALASQLDLARAIQKDIARSREAMEANPRMMEAVYAYAMVLKKASRDAEGLALVDAALARAGADPEAFTDADDFRNWMLNMRGYFLYDLGRTEEGRAALAEAAGLEERGEVNVSNIINYGGYLVAEGRAAEVVALIPRIGRASPYGQGWIESLRACAGAQLNDEAQRKKGLEYLAAHEADNPAAYSRALLCSNDLDGAAALMIRRLGGKDTRTGALLSLQVTPLTRTDSLPFARTLRARFTAVRDRADVRAAVDRVGRIETIPFSTMSGG